MIIIFPSPQIRRTRFGEFKSHQKVTQSVGKICPHPHPHIWQFLETFLVDTTGWREVLTGEHAADI